MKTLRLFFLAVTIHCSFLFSQTSADSVTLTFRTHQSNGIPIHVPGQFNNWTEETDTSLMEYQDGLKAWTRTYTFKLHDSLRTPLGDSVFQYKFNKGGNATGWYSDPLNPEQNSNDHSNSVLRMSKLFYFEFFAEESSTQIIRITTGIFHVNSDTLLKITFSTGTDASNITSSTIVSSSYDTTLRILNYILPAPIPKSNYIRLVAVSTNGDSIVYQNSVFKVHQLPMPIYANHGVTKASVLSNDSTTFRLKVPGKTYVVLRIAESGQPVATATPIVLNKDPLTDNWWVNVLLSSNKEYEFVYEIENGKQVTDPYGREVGQAGTKFSTGPSGLTADDYIWKTENYIRPSLNKLVIYELHIAEFGGGFYGKGGAQSGFTDLKNLLGHFDSLGVNAIELMPINDNGNVGKTGHSWGYNLNHYFALEPSYGTPLELKQLVDEAHAHGIAIILDVVFNHQNDTGPLWKMLPDESANPYFKSINDKRYNEDGLQFYKDMDHWTSETQELVLQSLRMWIDEYKIDGFRYDYTQGVGWNIDEPSKGILGWSNTIDTLYNGTIYQIAEHLPESPALIYHSGMTSGWHDSFRDELFDEARHQDRTLTNLENRVLDLGAFGSNDTPNTPAAYANRTEPVNATVTHDEQSLIYEMNTFQSVPIEEAVLRDKLYAVFIFGSLGIPMLWEGQEMSAPRGWQNDGQKLGYRPVEWSMLQSDRGKKHFEFYKSLVFQRRFNPALNHGQLHRLNRFDANKVLVWGMKDEETASKVMFVANLSGSEQTVSNVSWLSTGNWYDVFNQSLYTVPVDPVPSITIPAYTAKIYSNKTNAQLGIPTTVAQSSLVLPTEFSVSQNYPNPFNPATTIQYSLPHASFVTLSIYDVLGREVVAVFHEEKGAGEHQATLNASTLASGIYFYKLTAGNFSQTKRMLVLK